MIHDVLVLGTIDAEVDRHPAQTGRARRVPASAIAIAFLTAACVLGGPGSFGDPGYGAAAINRSGTDIVLRHEMEKWQLPAGSSGFIFLTLGLPEDAQPIDYEVLEAATCRVLGVQHVEFATYPDALITIGPGGAIDIGINDTLTEAVELATTDACPGPADGWALWIVNPTPGSFFVRTRSATETIVALVEPNSTAMAVGGLDEASTIDLLNDDCEVLTRLPRSGWGYFKGAIEGDSLKMEAGETPAQGTLSYGFVHVCGG